MSYFYNLYKEKISWDLLKYFNLKSYNNLPKIQKLIINVGCGNFFNDKKKMQLAYSDLFSISNQKPIFIKSKKSISNFKLRKGVFISIKVTLRSFLMYEFLYKFINIYIPCIKNFDGFSILCLDNFGNFNFGIKDQSIFQELNYNIDFIKGLNLNLVIVNSNNEKSLYLLKKFNFPFKN